MSDQDEARAGSAGLGDEPPQAGHVFTPEELRELLDENPGPAPTDGELADAIDREDEHAKRLREQYAALEHAGEVIQALMVEGLRVLPHLLAQVNADPKESGQRIADGLLRWLRKR